MKNIAEALEKVKEFLSNPDLLTDFPNLANTVIYLGGGNNLTEKSKLVQVAIEASTINQPYFTGSEFDASNEQMTYTQARFFDTTIHVWSAVNTTNLLEEVVDELLTFIRAKQGWLEQFGVCLYFEGSTIQDMKDALYNNKQIVGYYTIAGTISYINERIVSEQRLEKLTQQQFLAES